MKYSLTSQVPIEVRFTHTVDQLLRVHLHSDLTVILNLCTNKLHVTDKIYLPEIRPIVNITHVVIKGVRLELVICKSRETVQSLIG